MPFTADAVDSAAADSAPKKKAIKKNHAKERKKIMLERTTPWQGTMKSQEVKNLEGSPLKSWSVAEGNKLRSMFTTWSSKTTTLLQLISADASWQWARGSEMVTGVEEAYDKLQ
eukprot:6472715-Amphidinium_carterae.1